MFKKLCKYLEKFQCSRLCDSNNFWISSPISNKTTLNKSRSAVKICNAPQHRNVKADQKVKRAKDTCSCTTKPKLRESNVFSSQVRLQQTPDIQLTESESVFTSVQVQTNQYVPRPRFFTTRRLGYKNRSQAGLFPYTSGSVTPAISKSPVQDRHDSSVSAHDSSVSARNSRAASSNESTLRAVIGTQGIRHSFKLGCSANAKSRTQSGSLLGRLSHSPSRTPNSYRACRRGGPNIDDTGFHHKLRKVCSHSIQDSRVLRSNMESRHEFQVPSQRQAEENSDQDKVNRSLLLLESERCSVRSRHVEFCIVCRPSRAASLPPLANGLRSPSQEQAIHKTLFRSNSFGGTGMVDTSTLCQQKYTDTPITMYTLPDDRRICHRVGSGTRRYSPKRYLGSKSDFLAQQCQGDVGYNPGHSGAKTSPFQFNCTDTVRQQERRELHQEPGRPALQSPISNNKHVVSRNGRTQYRNDSSVHSRATEYRSRPIVQTENSDRMVPDRRSVSRNLRSLRDAGDRFVRIKNRAHSYQVRIARLQRLERRISQRIQQKMAVSASMGFPTSTSCASSSGASQQCGRDVHIDSAPVAQGVLETRCQEARRACTVYNNESPPPATGHEDMSAAASSGSNMSRGLACQGWSQQLAGWSEAEKSLLNSSWRPSTRKVYECIWSKWAKWCMDNSVNHVSPNAPNLAKYLAYLHLHEKLSYKTILVYKSAIATLTNPSSESLSDSVFVKRILKSIATANANKNHTNPSVWDPRVVVEWMIQNPISNLTLYEVSRRTALILLLASSRRVHDLTLLHISGDHFEDKGDHLIFHPMYGSKTDSYIHRQSSWKLMKDSRDVVCPVYWVRKLIEVSEQRRNTEQGPLSALFVTCRGAARAASRTVLAGWARSLLRAAGVDATAGSTRSAAASLNWLDNCNIDTVMAKGNWRTPNTFARFYSAEIRNDPRNNNNLSRNFDTV